MDMLCHCVSEGRRNALQDYQKTDGVRLVVVSPDSSHLTKSKKLSMAKCAKACSRNRRLPFTCRYVSPTMWMAVNTQKVKWFLEFLYSASHRYSALLSIWFNRPPNCFAYSCNSFVNYPGLPFASNYVLHSSPVLPSSLFSRAFLYDHKNRKCQWLSFDRNSPGAQSQQDFNYQLFQKKGALYCSTFSLYQLIPKWCLPPHHIFPSKKTYILTFCNSAMMYSLFF